ncbi:hypothetical protein IKF32_02765 [Candidatus Saccharibacteria bacterium]|nr:hypothetical protein [Candidatus Saccharibacteria bacterium]
MIIFTNLSDVLIKGVKETKQFVKNRYGQKMGEAYEKRLCETNSEFAQLLRGRMSEDAYWHVVLGDEKWPFGIHDIKKILSAALRDSTPGAMSVMQSITAHPTHLPACTAEIVQGSPEIYLVSDHIMERMEEIKSYHPKIFNACNRSFWSCEMSEIAADDRFFKDILKITDLQPNEAIYIDTNPLNTTAAVLSGIASIIYTTPHRLKKSLMEYSFSF